MKKLIIILTILFISIPLLSKEPKKGEAFDIYYKTQYQASFSYVEFEAMLEASKLTQIIKEIEDNKRIEIELTDNPWNLDLYKNNKFKTDVIIKWKSESGKIIKKVTLTAEFDIPKDGKQFPEWRKIYRDTAEIGFPLSIGLNIIFFLIILL